MEAGDALCSCKLLQFLSSKVDFKYDSPFFNGRYVSSDFLEVLYSISLIFSKCCLCTCILLVNLLSSIASGTCSSQTDGDSSRSQITDLCTSSDRTVGARTVRTRRGWPRTPHVYNSVYHSGVDPGYIIRGICCMMGYKWYALYTCAENLIFRAPPCTWKQTLLCKLLDPDPDVTRRSTCAASSAA